MLKLALKKLQTQRKELAKNVDHFQQPPVKRTTAEIMRVLEEKVAAHGSAQKIFEVLNTDNNGSLEADEIAEAIKPYGIQIDEAQVLELSQVHGVLEHLEPVIADAEYVERL